MFGIAAEVGQKFIFLFFNLFMFLDRFDMLI
jgi:hypothetical protein